MKREEKKNNRPKIMHKPTTNIARHQTSFSFSTKLGPSGSTRRQNPLKTIKEESPPSPEPTVRDLLKQVILEEGKAEQSWESFEEACKKYLKFTLLNPKPIKQFGNKLLKDGYFLATFIKVLCLNPYICKELAIQKIQNEFQNGIESQKQYFDEFIKSIEPPKKGSVTPAKSFQGSKLKRSILKSSEKKVRFGSDRIIYPALEQNIFVARGPPTFNQRRAKIQQKYAYIIDFLEINQIFLREQFEIIAILKEFPQVNMAVMIIRTNHKKEERYCAAVQGKQDQQTNPNPSILQQIERMDCIISGFIDMEGKDFSCEWIDSLATDKLY